MLLGVFYHAIMFIGGDGGRTTAPGLLDWIHSFRMPLFFLISGFFGQMMLGKYGLSGYLRRRWWRIGLPLFCASSRTLRSTIALGPADRPDRARVSETTDRRQLARDLRRSSIST